MQYLYCSRSSSLLAHEKRVLQSCRVNFNNLRGLSPSQLKLSLSAWSIILFIVVLLWCCIINRMYSLTTEGLILILHSFHHCQRPEWEWMKALLFVDQPRAELCEIRNAVKMFGNNNKFHRKAKERRTFNLCKLN